MRHEALVNIFEVTFKQQSHIQNHSETSWISFGLVRLHLLSLDLRILHFLYLQTSVMLQLHRMGEFWRIKSTALIIAYAATCRKNLLCGVQNLLQIPNGTSIVAG